MANLLLFRHVAIRNVQLDDRPTLTPPLIFLFQKQIRLNRPLDRSLAHLTDISHGITK